MIILSSNLSCYGSRASAIDGNLAIETLPYSFCSICAGYHTCICIPLKNIFHVQFYFNRGEKTAVLSELIRRTNAREMKWIIMVILKGFLSTLLSGC